MRPIAALLLLLPCIANADRLHPVECSKQQANFDEESRKALHPGAGHSPDKAKRLSMILDECEKRVFDARDKKIDSYVSRLASNPAAARLVFSADLCSAKEDRAEVMTKIIKQKRYAITTGIADLSALSSLRDELEDVDGRIEKDRNSLAHFHVSPRGCENQEVRVMKLCIDDPDQNLCDDDRMQAMVKFAASDFSDDE